MTSFRRGSVICDEAWQRGGGQFYPKIASLMDVPLPTDGRNVLKQPHLDSVSDAQLSDFYPGDAMLARVYDTAIPSVRPSVCHTRGLYQNQGLKWDKIVTGKRGILMASAEREPIGPNRVWGRAPSEVQGQSPSSGGQGAKPPEIESIYPSGHPNEGRNLQPSLYFANGSVTGKICLS